MIKLVTGDRCEFETCMTKEALLEEARGVLEFDSVIGAVAIVDDYGDVYVLDISLVPLEDARPDVAVYIEALLEDFEDEEGES
jgi:hypothetical protein